MKVTSVKGNNTSVSFKTGSQASRSIQAQGNQISSGQNKSKSIRRKSQAKGDMFSSNSSNQAKKSSRSIQSKPVDQNAQLQKQNQAKAKTKRDDKKRQDLTARKNNIQSQYNRNISSETDPVKIADAAKKLNSSIASIDAQINSI